jgi:signal transduction histidine kinase
MAPPRTREPNRVKGLFGSLAFQLSAAFAALLILFALGGLYAVGAFQRQVAADAVVGIAGRLELTAERMHAEAMQYKQNAPRDYPTYFRDVRLYYQNLSADVATFDEVVDIFMRGDFQGPGGWRLPWSQPRVSPPVAAAIRRIEAVWAEYRAELFEALGDDLDEPRLEWAAEHAMAQHQGLNGATQDLAQALRDWAAGEHRRIVKATLALALIGGAVVALILIALRVKVLRPLRRTIAGFAQVADGDFAYRLPVQGTTEVQGLTASFNRLAGRLDLLHRLLERLQQGNDLDELIAFIALEFRDLLGFDWIGVVSVDDTRSTARVEAARLDGEPHLDGARLLPMSGPLLRDLVDAPGPHLIADIGQELRRHPQQRLLAQLAGLGMRSAIALPLAADGRGIATGLVVFATRSPGRYDASHLRFLGNIAQLVTLSFNRTARLAERSRLAAVGELASGIAHELRTPLTTISMALDHLSGQALDPRSERRVVLASQESARVARLLEEILLYAKPIKLALEPVELGRLIESWVEEDELSAATSELSFECTDEASWVLADKDRLRQVFSNLTQNARNAATPGSVVAWRVSVDAQGVRARVHNGGEAIPKEIVPRLTEPFFSTRAEGTGLGLAIVQRLVREHGGSLEIRSEPEYGTEVGFVLPRLGGDEIPKGAAS